MTDTAVNDVVEVANEVAPEAPITQAVEAAVETAADPSVLNIVSDLELAHTLITEVKAKLAGLHPTVANLLKAIF